MSEWYESRFVENLIPLHEYIGQYSPDFAQRLEICINLADTVLKLHTNNFVHKGIQRDRVFVDASLGIVTAGYSDVAVPLELQHVLLPETGVLDDLAYMAPEQIADTGWKPDERTDVYSLGIVMYEIFVGQLPYDSTDDAGWIHAHMAHAPQLLNEDVYLPEVLRDIILRCIEKTPMNRYQSVYGLLSDLKKFETEYMTPRTANPFSLATHDVMFRSGDEVPFSGRRNDIQRLQQLLSEVRQGQTRVAFVHGEPGVGKSRLIHEFVSGYRESELRVAIATCVSNGQIHSPYEVLGEAVRKLVHRFVVELDTDVHLWMNRLRDALGPYAFVMAELLSSLGVTMSESTVATTVELPVSHSMSQYAQAFRRIIETMVSSEQPLVIVIDSFERADKVTLDFMEKMLGYAVPGLMWIIVDGKEEGPLQEWERSVTSALTPECVSVMRLEGLVEDEVQDVIAQSLKPDVDRAEVLVHDLIASTDGNPFLIHRKLRDMHDLGLLRFDVALGRWVWPEEGLLKRDSVHVETGKITAVLNGLDDYELNVLQWASCCEGSVDLPALAASAALDIGVLSGIVEALVSKQILEPTGDLSKDWYRFRHDDVRAACRKAMSEQRQVERHLAIGMYHVRHLGRDGDTIGTLVITKVNERAAFQILYHLSAAHSEYGRYDVLAHFCLNLGLYLEKLNMHERAVEYYRMGLTYSGHTGQEGASDDDVLKFDLCIGAARCAFTLGKLSEAEAELSELVQSAPEVDRLMQAYDVLVQLYEYDTDKHRAIRTAEKALSHLNLRLPKRASKLSLASDIIWIWFRTLGKSSADLLQRTRVPSREVMWNMKILQGVSAAAFHVNQTMMMMIFLDMMKLSIRHGNTELSPVAYSNFGMLLSSGLKRYRRGHEFCEVGLALAKQSRNLATEASCQFINAAFSSPWVESFRDTHSRFRESQSTAASGGNILILSNSILLDNILGFIRGVQLDEIQREIDRSLPIVRELQHSMSTDYLAVLNQTCDSIRGTTKRGREAFELPRFSDPIHTIVYGTTMLMDCYLTGRIEDGLKIANQIQEASRQQPIDFFVLPDSITLHALLLIRSYEKANSTVRRTLIRQIRTCERRLKHWATSNPKNFQHKYSMVRAEHARILKHFDEAEKYYELATQEASSEGFVHYSAIANELACRYFYSRNKKTIARAYTSAAIDDYQSWGSIQKARDLEQEFILLLRRGRAERRRRGRGDRGNPEGLPLRLATTTDLMTTIHVAQALSREVVVRELLEKLMTLLIQSAGAERGIIFLVRQATLYAELSTSVNEEDSHLFFEGVPALDVVDHFPVLVVDYVRHSGSDVVLEDAREDHVYAVDHYIRKNQVRSLVCVPIHNRQNLVGVLYLENNKIPSSFTDGRVQLLKVLASQAAISIENAKLYENLESQVASRTQELQQSRDQLANANAKLREVNRALENSNAAQITANAQLRESESLRKELIANISHDLRSPITLILGYSDAVLDQMANDPSAIQRALNKIKFKAESLNQLIQDLFQLAQLESNQADFEMESVTAEELLARVTLEFEHDITEVGVLFEYHGLEEATDVFYETWIEVDERKIMRAFGNLIYNAMKYTKPGDTISVNLERFDEHVEFSIVDTGAGIRPEDLPRIFDRFYKVDKSRNTGGSGLGLAITKEIVERHGGQISVESVLGEGTTFVISLPLMTSGAELAEGLIGRDSTLGLS